MLSEPASFKHEIHAQEVPLSHDHEEDATREKGRVATRCQPRQSRGGMPALAWPTDHECTVGVGL